MSEQNTYGLPEGPPYHMGPDDPGHLLPDADWAEVRAHAEKIQREVHLGVSETSEVPSDGVVETSGVVVTPVDGTGSSDS